MYLIFFYKLPMFNRTNNILCDIFDEPYPGTVIILEIFSIHSMVDMAHPRPVKKNSFYICFENVQWLHRIISQLFGTIPILFIQGTHESVMFHCKKFQPANVIRFDLHLSINHPFIQTPLNNLWNEVSNHHLFTFWLFDSSENDYSNFYLFHS